MTSSESSKRVPLGPTGELVAQNIKRHRGTMQYKELAERLAEVGRPIPALGLRRIEAHERRVDVDDLVALAVVFGVSPLTLLLPRDGSSELRSSVTGVQELVAHNAQWMWGLGEEPLIYDANPAQERAMFRAVAKPLWFEPKPGVVEVAPGKFRATVNDVTVDQEFTSRADAGRAIGEANKLHEKFVSHGDD